jgi:hypothetical protein
MRIITLLLLSFLYFNNINAQQVSRHNYKNECSLSYNNLMSFVFDAGGISYERTLYQRKNNDKFLSIQFDYGIKINAYGFSATSRTALSYLTTSVIYNFGQKHIYSVGLGMVVSLLNTTPACSFNYKYDFKKNRFTVGAGLQVSYLGLALSKEYYNPKPKIITGSFFSPYSYGSSLSDRFLFSVRLGRYF